MRGRVAAKSAQTQKGRRTLQFPARRGTPIIVVAQLFVTTRVSSAAIRGRTIWRLDSSPGLSVLVAVLFFASCSGAVIFTSSCPLASEFHKLVKC